VVLTLLCTPRAPQRVATPSAPKAKHTSIASSDDLNGTHAERINHRPPCDTHFSQMDNEVPLPPPRRIRHRSPSRLSPAGSVASSFRKSRRLSRFDDRSSQPSSDPALFSSDDIPASGLENYHAPVAGAGRKRRYRGTWWGEAKEG
jgi:hypothetical protein